jgi:hypothetical protein
MGYINEWAPVAGIWGFVVILFVPYLGPLMVAALLVGMAIALVRLAVSTARAVPAALHRLGVLARNSWQARLAARQPSLRRADTRPIAEV